jgi:O-antigen/teichoic acid export membrane protein
VEPGSTAVSEASSAPDSFGRGTVSRDAAWSLVYMGVVRLATAGLSIAVARRIGSAGAGAFGIVLQVCALGSMLAAFNLPQGLTKKLAEIRDPAQQHALLRAAWTLVPALSVVVGLGVGGLSGWLGAHVYHDPALSPIIFWCGPLIVATTCTQLVEGTLQGLGRFGTLARWGSAVSVLDLVFGIAGSWWGVVGVIISRSLVRSVAILIALRRWLRGEGGVSSGAESTATSVSVPGATVAPLLGFAGPALLSALIVLVCQTVLRLLLVRRSVLDAAGYFHAADSIAQGLLLIPSAVALAFMPAVSRLHGTGNTSFAGSLQRALERVAGYNLVLCLAFIGIAPWVMRALFGAGFGPAGPVAVLLGVAYGLAGPSAVLGAALLGRGEVWKAVALNLVWAAIVLVAYELTPGSWGASAAALAVGLGYLALALLYATWIAPTWKALPELIPSLSVTLASLGIAAALALAPGVPAPLAALVSVSLGLGIFWRWGLPSLPPGVRARLNV